MVIPTELESPAALPLHRGTALTAPYIVVGVRMPDKSIELNKGRTTVINVSPPQMIKAGADKETTSIAHTARCCH